MAQKVSLKSGAAPPAVPEDKPKGPRLDADALRERASPAAIVVAAAVLALGLGAAGFYAYNGGWKTAAQKDYEFRHTWGVLTAARHGDADALTRENALRKSQGQPLLQMPENRHQKANRARMLELSKKYGNAAAAQSPGSP